MVQTILVPLDGSEVAERAIPYVHVLAHRLPARVLLLRAVLTGPGSTKRKWACAEMQEARNELARIAGRLGQAGIEVDWLIPNDEAGWAITTAAREQAADLIVMSTHGRSGVGRLLYGSIAERVLRQASVPILLVPPRATFNWPADPTAFQIVVPLDGSEVAEVALGPATMLAQQTGGEMTLVQAFAPPLVAAAEGGLFAAYDWNEAAALARHSLAPAAAYLEQEEIPASAYVGDGAPHKVILDAVRNRHAHLIVMATHGRSGISRFVMGSVAEDVVRHAPVAVLLVRPEATVRTGQPEPRHEVAAC